VAGNKIARRVKIGDLTENMDLSRFANRTAKDEARLEKYRVAKKFLEEIE